MYFYEYEPVYRQHYLFTLQEHLKCKDINPCLVILVSSRPEDVTSRQAIRMTWGSQSFWWGHRIQTLFLLGQDSQRANNAAALSVEDESILYGDIIRQDFMDTYNNLTLKTIMAFQWVTEFCSNTRFLMKTNTDVFINTANLIKFLLKLNLSENIFTGYPLIDNFAYRGSYQKTYISYDEYPFRLYPPYCSGMGYILDGKLALRIYELMSHIKPIKLEDVYVGICLYLLNADISIPEDNQQFFLYKIDFDICLPCEVLRNHKNTDATTQFVLLFQKKIKNVIMRDTAGFRSRLAKAASAPAGRPRTHSHTEVAVGKTQPSPSKASGSESCIKAEFQAVVTLIRKSMGLSDWKNLMTIYCSKMAWNCCWVDQRRGLKCKMSRLCFLYGIPEELESQMLKCFVCILEQTSSKSPVRQHMLQTLGCSVISISRT